MPPVSEANRIPMGPPRPWPGLIARQLIIGEAPREEVLEEFFSTQETFLSAAVPPAPRPRTPSITPERLERHLLEDPYLDHLDWEDDQERYFEAEQIWEGPEHEEARLRRYEEEGGTEEN
jgi:hypothetical protein